MDKKKLSLVPGASIKTATIDISVLRVSRKKMTIAVFKQLLEETATNDLVWGRINYHPDNCSSEPAHIHFIWQKGNELRRDTIFINPFVEASSPSPEFKRQHARYLEIVEKSPQLFIAI